MVGEGTKGKDGYIPRAGGADKHGLLYALT